MKDHPREVENRQVALRAALDSMNREVADPDRVVEAAEKFYAFLSGGDK